MPCEPRRPASAGLGWWLACCAAAGAAAAVMTAALPPATAAVEAPGPVPDSIAMRVAAAGVVRIGTGNHTPPMGYIDAGGRWTGFDVELGDAIGHRLGLRVERVAVNHKTRTAYLAGGRIDLALSNIARTGSRAARVDFVDPPYLRTELLFVARKGRYASLAALGGARVGVNQGAHAYTAAPAAIARHAASPPRLLSFQKNAEALLALRQGKIDAYAQDSPIITGAVAAGVAAGDFELVGRAQAPGLYAIAVPRGDPRWRDTLAAALRSLVDDGSYERLYERWFGAAAPHALAHDARALPAPAAAAAVVGAAGAAERRGGSPPASREVAPAGADGSPGPRG